MDRRDFLKKAALLTGLGASLAAKPVLAQTGKTDNLIIIGWDGVGIDTLNRVMAQGRLPVFSDFILNRGWLYPMEIHGPTLTVPQWAQIFSGLGSDQTGCFGNEPLSKTLPTEDLQEYYANQPLACRGLDAWASQVPLKYSMFYEFKKAGYRTGMSVSKWYLGYSEKKSPFMKWRADIDWFHICGAIIGDQYLNSVMKFALKSIDWWQSTNQKYCFFIHLNPDSYGHQVSEVGARYEEEIVRCDVALGDVLAMANANILVMTDHGFDKGAKSHWNAPHGWLATDLPFCRNQIATTRDITPSLLAWRGIEWRKYWRRGQSLLA